MGGASSIRPTRPHEPPIARRAAAAARCPRKRAPPGPTHHAASCTSVSVRRRVRRSRHCHGSTETAAVGGNRASTQRASRVQIPQLPSKTRTAPATGARAAVPGSELTAGPVAPSQLRHASLPVAVRDGLAVPPRRQSRRQLGCPRWCGCASSNVDRRLAGGTGHPRPAGPPGRALRMRPAAIHALGAAERRLDGRSCAWRCSRAHRGTVLNGSYAATTIGSTTPDGPLAGRLLSLG